MKFTFQVLTYQTQISQYEIDERFAVQRIYPYGKINWTSVLNIDATLYPFFCMYYKKSMLGVFSDIVRVFKDVSPLSPQEWQSITKGIVPSDVFTIEDDTETKEEEYTRKNMNEALKVIREYDDIENALDFYNKHKDGLGKKSKTDNNAKRILDAIIQKLARLNTR